MYYAELPKSKLLRNAPLAWVCGDLHLESFGSYKGDNRLVYFDLNDFDEAVLAPCTWDLLRFLTSVLVGAATLKLTNPQAQSLSRGFLDAYVGAIQEGKARWVEPQTAQGIVKELLDGSRTRKRKAFLDSRTVRAGGKRKIRVDGKRALPVTAVQRASIKAFMRSFAKRQRDPKFYRLIDLARRIAGTGSLGVERYVLLVEGKGSPDGNYLLDLKQTLQSALAPHLAWKQPKWKSEAHRVVTLQHRVQAISTAFLTPVVIGKDSYVLRGLQPIGDRVALANWNGDLARLQAVVSTMGQLVAWGQLRSSGREGAATVDELIAFWAKRDRTQKLLSLALECKAQVERDWQDYCQAYDRCALPQLKAPSKGVNRRTTELRRRVLTPAAA